MTLHNKAAEASINTNLCEPHPTKSVISCRQSCSYAAVECFNSNGWQKCSTAALEIVMKVIFFLILKRKINYEQFL